MHHSSVFCLGLVGKDDDDDKKMKMKRNWKAERTTMKTGKASSSMDNDVFRLDLLSLLKLRARARTLSP
jgi:hypothetical protein